MIKKFKKCDKCSSQAWTSKTIDGIKVNLCQKHSEILKKKSAKEKRAKQREKKRENVTEKKLDGIFSLWIRHCYPQVCHSTLKPMKGSEMHCAHFIGRNNRCVRFDTRNCYPTAPSENMYNQLHVIELAKRLKEYYNIEYTEWSNHAKRNTCKITPNERKIMYDIFKEAYHKALDCLSDYESRVMDYEDYISVLTSLRKEVIEKTKLIL